MKQMTQQRGVITSYSIHYTKLYEGRSVRCMTRVNTISDTITSGAFTMTSPTKEFTF